MGGFPGIAGREPILSVLPVSAGTRVLQTDTRYRIYLRETAFKIETESVLNTRKTVH